MTPDRVGHCNILNEVLKRESVVVKNDPHQAPGWILLFLNREGVVVNDPRSG